MKVIDPQLFFKHFANKNQIRGFYISGTLVEIGLNVLMKLLVTLKNNNKVLLTRKVLQVSEMLINELKPEINFLSDL